MSLTFSDPGNISTLRRFRRSLIATLAVLGVVAVGAATSTLSQGPQLRISTIDEASAIRTSGSTLVLRSDRALGEVQASQIRITPDASFRLDTTDLDVRIVFDNPVQAGTEYRIEIDQVRPRALGASASWTTTFTTPPEEFFFLRKADSETELVRVVLDGSSPEVLYKAPGIISYAPVGVVYAVLRDVAGEKILELVDPASGGVDRIAMAPGLSVAGLATASWGTNLIVTVDTDPRSGLPATSRAFAVLDAVGTRTPDIPLGADGRPLATLKVAVSAVSGRVVVWLQNQTLVLFDPLTETVLPLGVAQELWGFDSEGRSVIFVDSLGTVAVDLQTREETRVPAGTLDGFPVSHEFTTQSPKGDFYQRVLVPGFEDGPPFALVTVDASDGRQRRVVGSLERPESMGSLGLSANGQYLIVETNPETTRVGFAGLPADVVQDKTELVLFDVVADVIAQRFQGYSFSW